MTIRKTTLLLAALLALGAGSVPLASTAQTLPPPPPPPVPAPSTPAPSPQPEPSPSESPSPFASPSPSPGASALPSFPIRLDRMRVGVVPGGTVTVGVSGGTGPLAAQASFDGVVVRYDTVTRTLFVTGRAFGRGTVTLSDAAGDTASVAVLVAPPAGVVPADATVELAGNVTGPFAAARIRAAIAQTAQMQPGTTLDMGGVTPGDLRPGQVLEARANVVVKGNDTYVDQTGTTNVHVRVDALPPLEPAVLFYSDDPERLGALDDGVLFRGTIDVTRPARAYIYHVSDSPNRRLYLALQPTAATARVQVLGAVAGPSDAFAYVGHTSTVRYLVERASQESFVASLLPSTPYLLPLGAGAMLPGTLVNAIYDVRVLDGAPVNVLVVAASNGVDPATLLAQPEHSTDAHYRRGEFSLASVPPLALTYTAGAPEPPPFAIGVRYYANGQAASEPAARRRRGSRTARAAGGRLWRAAQRHAAVREPDSCAAKRLSLRAGRRDRRRRHHDDVVHGRRRADASALHQRPVTALLGQRLRPRTGPDAERDGHVHDGRHVVPAAVLRVDGNAADAAAGQRMRRETRAVGDAMNGDFCVNPVAFGRWRNSTSG